MEHAWVSRITFSLGVNPNQATGFCCCIITSTLSKSRASWESWFQGGQSTGKELSADRSRNSSSAHGGHNWFIDTFHDFDLSFCSFPWREEGCENGQEFGIAVDTDWYSILYALKAVSGLHFTQNFSVHYFFSFREWWLRFKRCHRWWRKR